MKISAFYYLSYPDCGPPDAEVAMTEVYVEIADDEGDINNFRDTYALTVCTVGFLRIQLATRPYFCCRSLLVVERFDDDVIRRALDEILPTIQQIATKK